MKGGRDPRTEEKAEEEVKKRLAALEVARDVRQRISRARGSFPEINAWIREIREGSFRGE